MALADYQQLVSDLVRDQSGMLTPATQDRAIEQARLRYSADCLRTVVADVTWPSSGVFGPAPDGWSEAAWLKSAEYPVGQLPQSYLHLAAYRSPAGWALECVQALPQGAVVRLTFTTEHQISAQSDTVPAQHRMALASFAAGILCNQLATYYSGQRETVINADASSTDTRAREYAARAKSYRTDYYMGIGQPDPYAKAPAVQGSGATAAASVGAWPGRRRARLINMLRGDL